MIRMDEIYHDIFWKEIGKWPYRSMHFYDQGELIQRPLCVFRKKKFIFWDSIKFNNNQIETLEDIDKNFPSWFTTIVTSEYNNQQLLDYCQTKDWQLDYYCYDAWKSMEDFRGYNNPLQTKNNINNPNNPFECIVNKIPYNNSFEQLKHYKFKEPNETEYNFKWFYSNEFEQILWKELTDMIKQW